MKGEFNITPRIGPLSSDQYGPEAIEIIGALLKVQSKPDRDDVPEFIATMLRHKRLFKCQIDMTTQLFKGELAFRDIELVLLRTTWLCQAPFCFGEHVKTAKQSAGLTAEEIDWITVGWKASGWDAHSRSLLRATDELHETSAISDETWAELASRLSDKQLIELPILVGHIHGVAYVQNALRVRLMEGNDGLTSR